jgi:hypothetical protein
VHLLVKGILNVIKMHGTTIKKKNCQIILTELGVAIDLVSKLS